MDIICLMTECPDCKFCWDGCTYREQFVIRYTAHALSKMLSHCAADVKAVQSMSVLFHSLISGYCSVK